MKIVTIVGARPQFIKAATLSRLTRQNRDVAEILVHTGQHYDNNMSEVFFRELGIPEPDYNLGVGSGTHAEQTGAMLVGIEKILLTEKPDITLVYGDTNSTVAGALAAAKLNIPLAHVEAGLRSFNRAMPEEINRIITDRIAQILFAPTQTAADNLAREGLGGITRLSGDVMYDSVLFYKARILSDPGKYQTPGIPADYLLATIHRAENTDHPGNLQNIFRALSNINGMVILPIHPRTRKIVRSSVTLPANVNIIDPVGYLEMMKLTMDARKVLTDSGGLQKEAYFLGKQCITLRTETEWVETLHDHWNIITGSDPILIQQAVETALPSAPAINAFGDGKSADFILQQLIGF